MSIGRLDGGWQAQRLPVEFQRAMSDEKKDSKVKKDVPLQPVQRGRKRSKEVDKAILKATRELLTEKGYADLTVNSIIARAGVSSATLYRRWSNLAEVVAAALGTLGPEPMSIDSGSLDGDLHELVLYLGNALTREDEAGGAWVGTALRVEAGLRRSIDEVFVKPRKEMLAAILDRAHQRGELAAVPDLSDAWSFVSGPIYHRTHIRLTPFTPEFAADAALVLGAGLRALAAQRKP